MPVTALLARPGTFVRENSATGPQYERLRVVDPREASDDDRARLSELWEEMRRSEVLDFPPAGEESLSGWRRELDELVIRIAGVEDPIEASDLVDAL
jgi:hypothetical protein